MLEEEENKEILNESIPDNLVDMYKYKYYELAPEGEAESMDYGWRGVRFYDWVKESFIEENEF